MNFSRPHDQNQDLVPSFKRDKEKEPAPQVSSKIRAELNFEKWAALFATSKFKGRSREVFRKFDEGKVIGVVIGKQHDDRGRILEVGVLRVPDLKVFYGLIKLWEQAGRPETELVFAGFRQLAKVLDKDWGTEQYQQLKLALQKLRRIPIDWLGSFYQKDTDTLEEYISQINVLSSLEFYRREKGSRLKQVGFAFKFHDRILRNLLNNYTKPLYFDEILKLKKELAVLLYCHLDLIMADKERYERKTKELFEDLGIDGEKYQYPSARRQNLEPALKELIGLKLSTGILQQAYLQKTKDGRDLKAVFKKQPFKTAITSKPEWEIKALVIDMLEVLEDEQSRPFYIKVASLCPQDLIYRCLSEVKDEAHRGLIRTTKGAVFTDKLKRYCQERGIELGLKPS